MEELTKQIKALSGEKRKNLVEAFKTVSSDLDLVALFNEYGIKVDIDVAKKIIEEIKEDVTLSKKDLSNVNAGAANIGYLCSLHPEWFF